MDWGLRNQVYYCVAGQQVALLDLKQDRYFCLPPRATSAFKKLVETGVASEQDMVDLGPLLRSELLQPHGRPFSALKTVAAAKSSALNDPKAHPRLSLVVSAVAAQIFTIRALKRQTLVESIDGFRKQKLAGKSNAYSLRDLTHAFLVTRRLIVAQDRCLRWSLAMASYLAKHGHGAGIDLVLGVRMAPFAAHAWVQAGDKVLSDHVDHVQIYTPIMVI